VAEAAERAPAAAALDGLHQLGSAAAPQRRQGATWVEAPRPVVLQQAPQPPLVSRPVATARRWKAAVQGEHQQPGVTARRVQRLPTAPAGEERQAVGLAAPAGEERQAVGLAAGLAAGVAAGLAAGVAAGLAEAAGARRHAAHRAARRALAGAEVVPVARAAAEAPSASFWEMARSSPARLAPLCVRAP